MHLYAYEVLRELEKKLKKCNYFLMQCSIFVNGLKKCHLAKIIKPAHGAVINSWTNDKPTEHNTIINTTVVCSSMF